MRYNFSTTATQKRLGAYSSDKASYATVSGVTLIGYFAPITPTDGVDVVSMIDQGYQFVTDGPTDIRPNDQLTISSIVYGVKGVQRFTQLSQDVLICSLTKVVTN